MPKPVTPDELKQRFASLPFAGHKSPKQISVPDKCRERGAA
jgi:hypothetical protein